MIKESVTENDSWIGVASTLNRLTGNVDHLIKGGLHKVSSLFKTLNYMASLFFI